MSEVSGEGAFGSMIRSQLRCTSEARNGLPSENSRFGTHVERDLAAAVGEGPRRGQCRLEVQVGVVRRQRLEELGHDRGAAGVALDRRVERIGRPGQDLDRPIRAGSGRRGTCPDQRRKQGQAEEDGEGATHRAEYTFGSVGGPFLAPSAGHVRAAGGRVPGME